jgi:hypothetical protein
VVDRLLALLLEMKVTISGIIANMTRGTAESVRELAGRAGVSFAGEVPFDETVEGAVGDPSRLAATPAAAGVYAALKRAGLAERS